MLIYIVCLHVHCVFTEALLKDKNVFQIISNYRQYMSLSSLVTFLNLVL